MNACTLTFWRCLPSCLGLMLFATAVSIPAVAGDNELAVQPETATENWCALEAEHTEELCGWIHPATHDSAPRVVVPSDEPVSASDSISEAPITAVAALAFASAGMSIEQIVEPLAMVGPYLDRSLESLKQFESYWDAAVQQAEKLRAEQNAARDQRVEDQLSQIADEEPIDIESYGPSVLVGEMPESTPDPGIEITVLDPLVGSSAIIATIEESYMPYDIAAKDLPLWSVLPTSTRPFCIRSHAAAWDASSMWDEFDHQVAAAPAAPHQAAQAEILALYGSVDCMMEDLMWRFGNWMADDSELWVEMDARQLGRRLAGFVAGRTRIVQQAAEALASRWPEVEPDNQPSPAGEALLVRAGAVAADSPAEIAEATSTLHR